MGSASSEQHDQTLDSVLVGPVPAGRHRFVFQANAPDPARIPEGDAVGVTVVLLTCSYKSLEFVRVGYYVNNEYQVPELAEDPPPKPLFEKVQYLNALLLQSLCGLYIHGVLLWPSYYTVYTDIFAGIYFAKL